MWTWVFYWDWVLREDLACALDESMRDAHAIWVGHAPAAVDNEGGSAAGLNLDTACFVDNDVVNDNVEGP